MSFFIEHAKALRGEEGEQWAKAIPQIITQFEQTWNITVGEPFSLSYNYAAPVKRADGRDAVIKIGFPGDSEFLSEITALQEFGGKGCVRLLAHDKKNAVILLERVLPGKPLHGETIEHQAKIASSVLKRLWKKAPQNDELIRLEKWFLGFERHRKKYGDSVNPIPQELFVKAEELFEKLLNSTHESMLIHGDFNHNNILSSNREGWLVIDPKGVIGDPLYDTSVFLYNYLPDIADTFVIKQTVEKRIAILSHELEADPQRIKDWGIAQSVLSCIWSLEDKGQLWQEPLVVAQILAAQ